MLRNVCDCCGKIIDGEPIEQEYPDMTLLMDDDVVLAYENMCDGCKCNLREGLADFKRNNGQFAKPTPIAYVHDSGSDIVDELPPVTPDDDMVVHVQAVRDTPEDSLSQPQLKQVEPTTRQPFESVDLDSLPNQVTKRFPVKLPEHKS